jgi:hypothetical protein
MQAYRIAVFLALLGAMTGAINSTMALGDGSDDWFSGSTSGQNLTTGMTAEQAAEFAEAMQNSGGSGVSDVSTLTQDISVVSVGISMLSGVLNLGGAVDEIFFGNTQSEVRSAFAPFLTILSVGADAIYAMALIQLWRKTPIQGAY